MATNKDLTLKLPAVTKPTVKSAGRNLESFACLWLDKNVDLTQENRDTKQELRKVINHLRTFDNSGDCEKYIQSVTQEKINGVFVDRDKLVAAVSKDQITRAKMEDGASISVVTSGVQSLEARNAIFMWFQLFIEVLLRMHHKSSDRKELVDICKESYKNNADEMKTIAEFEKTYKPENAIWWYTRESCFYRMMNKALRVQDFDMLFALRFLITDIAKQLRSEYEKFLRTSDTRALIRVYRGQRIDVDELELIKNNVGQFISMNSFLSTSRERSTALDFARLVPITANTKPILFEIEINPRLQTKAFADVTQLSYFKSEGEVLVMLGALFRIEKVAEDKKNSIWVACVSLASEDDFHLKETFVHMKETIGDDTDLDSLGKILIEMGEYDQAQKCYELMVHDLQIGASSAYYGLGRIAYGRKNTSQALQYARIEKSIKESVFPNDHADLANFYSWIGLLYWSDSDYDQALLYLNKAVKIQEEAKPVNFRSLGKTYNRLAITYDLMGNYTLAEEYYKKTLQTQETALPPDHPDIALTYNNLGCLYRDKGNHAEALKYFKKSLSISRKVLPPGHADIVRTENNIHVTEDQMRK